MSKERRTIARWMLTLLVAGLAASVVIFTGARVAKAHIVPFPCDFTTGGGFVITDNGYHANFGLVGGCKHDGFFGHVNFVDHDETGEYAGLHVSSDSIDAYFEPAPGSNVRDICGTADTHLFGTVKFRARTEDNSDPSPGDGRGVDKFGLKLTGVSPPYTGIALSRSAAAAGGAGVRQLGESPSQVGSTCGFRAAARGCAPQLPGRRGGVFLLSAVDRRDQRVHPREYAAHTHAARSSSTGNERPGGDWRCAGRCRTRLCHA